MGSLWNRSGTIERYADDLRAAGAKAYFYNGGTTTPLSVFQDAGEAAAHPHPVVADANGRWPDIFVPYIVSYDVRVTSAFDVQLTFTQSVPNPNPVDVTTTAPASQLVQTGMVHAELINTTKSGYVRLNGRTMGNAASTGTERANADTADLFAYLWNNLANAQAPVSGGRGGTAAADYAANKTITLPDCRGTLLTGLDDMGNSALSSFAGLTFTGGSATAAGSTIGINGATITTGNLPAHTHTATTDSGGLHSHGGVTTIQSPQNHTHSGTTGAGSAHQHDAFIGDDGHTHDVRWVRGDINIGAGSLASFNVGNNLNTAAVGSGFANKVTQDGADTALSKATGVKVRSTAGNAATADQKTANESAHTHSFTSGNQSVDHTHVIAPDGTHNHTLTTDPTGSGSLFSNLAKSMLVTWFIKL